MPCIALSELQFPVKVGDMLIVYGTSQVLEAVGFERFMHAENGEQMSLPLMEGEQATTQLGKLQLVSCVLPMFSV